jgi:Ca2+-dependent lipid-binding protein
MATAPATEAGIEADAEESSEACTAKTTAQSGNDTELVSAMEAEGPDEDGAFASAAAPASPVENTDGGNAPETDARDETDSKKSDESGSDEPPKKSTPMTTPLPDFDSLNGNKLAVWEEKGLWPFKMLVLDLTDLQQHFVYRRIVDIHMQGEGLKLEYIDSVNICLNFISQILDNLEVEGHARGCEIGRAHV